MIEREQMEMDVVFVGAGPANLAAALHLKKESRNTTSWSKRELNTAKDRRSRDRHRRERLVRRCSYLVGRGDGPDRDTRTDAGFSRARLSGRYGRYGRCGVVSDKRNRLIAPITPPPLKNKGKYIVSLSKRL